MWMCLPSPLFDGSRALVIEIVYSAYEKLSECGIFPELYLIDDSDRRWGFLLKLINHQFILRGDRL